MGQEYYAHYRETDQEYQLNSTHQKEVADLAEEYCRLSLLKDAVWLIGFHHDQGKNTAEWQEYFEKKIHDEKCVNSGKEDHSTLGGLVVEQDIPKTALLELMQIAIYMHHGLMDCISADDGKPLVWKRKQKYTQEQVKQVWFHAQTERDNQKIRDKYQKAKIDLKKLAGQIEELANREQKNRYGNRDFYLGMCERMLLSCLMDGDWRNTADFMGNKNTVILKTEEIQTIWDAGLDNLEKKLTGFKIKNQLDEYRREISNQCRQAAQCEDSRFRLSVPTGSGKTLSSLLFALQCAKKEKKRHIFYVAPFRSILDQNAEVIRDALGMKGAVLEHHGDVVQESDEEIKRYEYLIENWDESPIIVTTAVQFFNTLFKEKRSNIRRFHSLCDSVIILDEVQSLPVKVVELFNMAMNFLSEFCNSTVVLCTATQPLFDKIAKNRLLPMGEMTTGISVSDKVFQRVEFHDETQECPHGLTIAQTVDKICSLSEKYSKILVILNTKGSVKAVYEGLKQKSDRKLFHLSTNMCQEHREHVLEQLRITLGTDENMICVTTQLIEAGVDISFPCVIRAMAGLDNLIQAAGRCNRNGGPELGHVYLIKLSADAEHLSSIPDIRKAQNAMEKLLAAYHENPQAYNERLDSEKAIQDYYQFYFYERQQEMAYDVKLHGVNTTLVESLSRNQTLAGNIKGIYLKQAFKSAGEAFSLIEEKGGKDIVVPYDEGKKLILKLQETSDFQEEKRILKKLQRYSVNLSDTQMKRLGNAIYRIKENGILVLAEGYYDLETGVTIETVQMPFLGY